MLKLIYTERGLHMEHLVQVLEDWVTARVMLSLRAATPLYVEPSTACFLLPADLPQLAVLATANKRQPSEALAIARCDADYVEVSLNGTWLAESAESDTGLFIATLAYNLEFVLHKLWQAAAATASVASD
ncbi:MAG: hypothetical protein HC910_02385 [Spirulinaceae cyanobacterium SM2_1_0]|nr:hypothetical protein [Spirulinaceae cyanobacterium SM2_1_0]